MKLFRPGFPPIFSGEDEKDQPAPPVKPQAKAAPGFLSPEQAMAAAIARHVASGGTIPQQVQQPPRSTDNLIPTQQTGVPTQVISTVVPQPLIDKAAEAENAAPPEAPQPEQPEPTNTSVELTPEEEAELDALLAKRDHIAPTETPHS